jgi:hypothetical protein
MEDDTGRSSTGTLEGPASGGANHRLGEERARQILERAAALDAKRSSEIDIAQLREAAAAAGISLEAFEQALREDAQAAGGEPAGREGARPASALIAPSSAQVSHYAGILRDLLGEDAQVVVVEDRIEAQDGEGVTVSINPSSGDATAAVLSEGRLRRRLLAVALPIVIPFFMGMAVLIEEEEAGIGLIVGAMLAVTGSLVATVVSDRRERKALRRKAERIRRQLQRLLGPGPDQA